MNILVTGGAGYIGSHTCIELLENGHEVIIVDNLSNSSMEAVKRVEQISGKTVTFKQVDLCDKTELKNVFSGVHLDAVIHFAGLKAVGESVSIPLRYYENNLIGTMNLLELMKEYQVQNIVFSSSATVYGDPASVPIKEDFPLSATNPYGRTKLMIEEILKDIHHADPSWNITILRYFNPVGAHESGLIGEDPNGIPNNLMPYISKVAVGSLEQVNVFGNDYPTPDGTGIRDYIHVVDLAKGHVSALNHMGGLRIYNLGTGKGYSVLDVIQAFAKASGRQIPYRFTARRPGDIAECYADCTKAKQELNWEAKRDILDMCQSAWNWQSKNPNGYKGS